MTTRTLHKRSAVGLRGHCIDWDMMENVVCQQLVDYGMHAQTISDVTRLTVAQVYNRCRLLGISVVDYRKGKGSKGEVIVAKAVKVLEREDR